MNYLEALAQNRDHGVRIRRKSWDPDVFLTGNGERMAWDARSLCGASFADREHMLADDWEVEAQTVVKEVPVFKWTSKLPNWPGYYAIKGPNSGLYIREVSFLGGKLVVATDDRRVYCENYATSYPGVQWCLIDPVKLSAVIESGSE